MTFQRSFLLIALALLMAACSAQAPTAAVIESPPAETAVMPQTGAETTTEAPVQTEAPALVTQEPASTEAVSPTLEQTEPAASPASGSVEVYKIVPGESQLKYEVGEVFLNQGNAFNVAIGTTPHISGEITIDLANPQNSVIGPISADISQFTSDNGRRDNALRDRFIQSSRFPMVTFTPTEIIGLPESYQEGQEVTLTVRGDVTIRDVTRPVEFPVKVRLGSGELTGSATATILMSDFGFGPIDIAGILKTEDEAKVTLDFVARP